MESKVKNYLKFLPIILIIFLLSCRQNEEQNDFLDDIPADPVGSVPETQRNNLVPSGTIYTIGLERRRINLSGVLVNNIGVELYGTGMSNQNVWVEIENINKGILVKKVSSTNRLKADIVFCVDVSGSMNDAIVDSIANTLSVFADYIYRAGIDARFGGIGFVGDIRGVKLLTDDIANFRTWIKSKRFIDSSTQVLFPNFGASAINENPVAAIRYADSLFNWRSDAQRVFIVFTDVPVKPNSRIEWSNSWVRDNLRARGVVHVVFASDTSRYTNLWSTPNLTYQNPRELATITGGTYRILPDGINLNLIFMPFVESLVYSHSIDFLTGSGIKNVKIVLYLSQNYNGRSSLIVNFP